MHSTISEETISELPLVIAHDNLVLARELMKSKDFAGVSFALNHAKEALIERLSRKTVKEKDVENTKVIVVPVDFKKSYDTLVKYAISMVEGSGTNGE